MYGKSHRKGNYPADGKMAIESNGTDIKLIYTRIFMFETVLKNFIIERIDHEYQNNEQKRRRGKDEEDDSNDDSEGRKHLPKKLRDRY